MNLPLNTQRSSADVSLPHQDALMAALDALGPSERQKKNDQFQRAYPAIERALSRKVPQKTLLAELDRCGLGMSMGSFRQMLESERKARAERGEGICCEHCGSLLPTSIEPEETTAQLISTGTTGQERPDDDDASTVQPK
ncbi:hypothetical protein [Paraburkholderia sp.]|jgi:hypothetical protein|uniref:hypothetical protein n=1 Tax=Paraburkholderia sp. TaxID=1926495 RepID=UPI003C7D4C37